MSRTRIAVTNVFGPLNRGDFELFHQLLEAIGSDPSIEIHAIARDPEGCRRHFPGVIFHPQPGVAAETKGKVGRIAALFRTVVLYFAARLPSLSRMLPLSQRGALSAIQTSDLVIACPGGYLTGTSWSFYPQLAQLEYAVQRGKQVWLAPMSVGPAQRHIHRLLLGRMLHAANQVYVRESWSEKFCRDLGVSTIRSADLALRPARDWLNRDNDEFTPSFVTATVVRWDFPDDADPNGARERYHRALAEALDAVAERFRVPVKFLLQVDNDREVTESVAGCLRAEHEIIRVETPDDYRHILKSSHLMIGSRFHSAIFSMSVGCPTVVISYLPKARYMMEDMNLGSLVHDIDQVNFGDLMRSVNLLTDPGSNLVVQARRAILRQTEDEQNPFVTDVRAELRLGGIA